LNGQDARSTLKKLSCGTGILSVLFSNGQDARSTLKKLSCGTGILPVLFSNGQDARSTLKKLSLGTGILPVPKVGKTSHQYCTQLTVELTASGTDT
jgi:hypothetical protein